MMRTAVFVLSLTALAALVACGEKPQALQTFKGDVPAYQGANDKFVAAGWKPGDKANWEESLKARMQNSQNEYNRMSAAPAAK